MIVYILTYVIYIIAETTSEILQERKKNYITAGLKYDVVHI